MVNPGQLPWFEHAAYDGSGEIHSFYDLDNKNGLQIYVS
jgi:hypothetical protein